MVSPLRTAVDGPRGVRGRSTRSEFVNWVLEKNLTMNHVDRLGDDDPDFIDQIRWIFAGCLAEYRPAEFYVVRIRDWFDYKWCYFTGKVLGAVGVSRFPDLTLPPFVPNRVLSQDHYDRVGPDGLEYERSDAPPLHIHQHSESNFRRFIRRITNDGTFLWYSNGSLASCRGSMMVYNVSPEIKFGGTSRF
jgi:hypothetical protein